MGLAFATIDVAPGGSDSQLDRIPRTNIGLSALVASVSGGPPSPLVITTKPSASSGPSVVGIGTETVRALSETGAVEHSGRRVLAHSRRGAADPCGGPEARDSMVELWAPLVVWWARLWNLLGHQQR